MEPDSLLTDAIVAITGGTGTLGQALTAELLTNYQLHKLIIISRSESRQAIMKQRWPESESSPIRYFLADVRDQPRLQDCFEGADIVIHAAALKRVEVCEREPSEAILTNVIGTLNAARAARARGIQRFLFISSDKCCQAATLYGGTKYVAERLAIGMNNYRGPRTIRYSAVRYGNVLGSTGSVLDAFRTSNGNVPITDRRCTRFFLTPQMAAHFVLSSLPLMHGGEVFIPRLKSASILTLAEAFAPQATPVVVGLRGAEKLHECLLSADESHWAVELPDRYVLLPSHPFWSGSTWPDARSVPDGFSFTSELADRLTAQELQDMADALAT